jgi:hypothetical protein
MARSNDERSLDPAWDGAELAPTMTRQQAPNTAKRPSLRLRAANAPGSRSAECRVSTPLTIEAVRVSAGRSVSR